MLVPKLAIETNTLPPDSTNTLPMSAVGTPSAEQLPAVAITSVAPEEGRHDDHAVERDGDHAR